jgi:hypothetical protein
LDIAQAAQLTIQQVLTIARPEQAPGDHDFASMKLLLIKLASANLQDHGRRSRVSRGSRLCPIIAIGGKGASPVQAGGVARLSIERI